MILGEIWSIPSRNTDDVWDQAEGEELPSSPEGGDNVRQHCSTSPGGGGAMSGGLLGLPWRRERSVR